MQQFVKIVCRFLLTNASVLHRTFTVCLWICAGGTGIRYCGAFAIWSFYPLRLRTGHSFTGRQAFVPQKRRRTFADYSALSRIAAYLQVQHNYGAAITVRRTRLIVQWGHVMPHFQVPLWCVCCTLFDVYHTVHVPTFRSVTSMDCRVRFPPEADTYSLYRDS